MHESSFTPCLIICALILDFILGESKIIPHPVVLFGRVISWANENYNDDSLPSSSRKSAGVFLALLLPAAVFILMLGILKIAFFMGWIIGASVTLYLAYTTLSARGLRDAAQKVYNTLFRNDLPAAREALSHIVGRDTSNLYEAEIVRGAVETVAENSSDGVIAPLFYLILGGVPLAMAYKAVNTLDSMVGYKNDRFRDFGWASARLDDAVNFIPARVTALLIVFSAWAMDFDWKRSWRTILRDCRKHPSPNAGFPEAAAAGALGVQLGGVNRYPGRVEERPGIGDAMVPFEREHIKCAVQLMYGASLFMVLFGFTASIFFS